MANVFQANPVFRMDVTANNGATYWCIEELSFYDSFGTRLTVDRARATAQSQYSIQYGPSMAFNEESDGDASYYCSQYGITTGWLQYVFSSSVVVASYKVERLNDHGDQYSPVAWAMKLSTDGGNTWMTVDDQSGQTGWGDGEVRTFTISTSQASLQCTK